MVQANQTGGEIQGRGGAALVYLGQSGLNHEFLLTSGASREEQFDDFWTISVGLSAQGRTFNKTKLEIRERDEYTPRNALCAVAQSPTKLVIFGGQDS